VAIGFLTEDEPPYGAVEQVSPLVRRVVARNPSRFTYHGTGTFILGPPEGGRVAVVDAGPDDADHVAAVLAAVEGQEVTHLLVTHTHPDHSPATAAVQAATSAPTFGFGPHPEAAVRAHEERKRRAVEAGEEPESDDGEGGGDLGFVPDHAVVDGDVLEGDGLTIECLHTPGHISNHVCFSFAEESTLFSGDHVMGWSTSVIPAPDGDLNDYLANLRRLVGRDEARYRPTHGPAIKDRAARLRAAGDLRVQAHLDAQVGRDQVILMEGPRMGRTEQFAEVRFDRDMPEGQIITARISSHDGKSLFA
jgi:glyoxylase-like metal-dependent hydrolase (beta-lactamase superfamily II)